MRSLLQSSGRDTGYVFTVTGEYPVNNLGRAATRTFFKKAYFFQLNDYREENCVDPVYVFY